MDLGSATLTLGLALEQAHQRGLPVDVATSSGQTFAGVTVATLDRFCIVLLDDDVHGKAHVVSRDALTSVSMGREALLAISAERAASSRARDGEAFVVGVDGPAYPMGERPARPSRRAAPWS